MAWLNTLTVVLSILSLPPIAAASYTAPVTVTEAQQSAVLKYPFCVLMSRSGTLNQTIMPILLDASGRLVTTNTGSGLVNYTQANQGDRGTAARSWFMSATGTGLNNYLQANQGDQGNILKPWYVSGTMQVDGISAASLLTVAPAPSATWNVLLNQQVSATVTIQTVSPSALMPVAPSSSATFMVIPRQGDVWTVSGTGAYGVQGPFSMSTTGTAVFIGGKPVTYQVQTTGVYGTTIYADVSNADTAPPTTAGSQWTTITSSGVITNQPSAGGVDSNGYTVPSGWRWLKWRVESSVKSNMTGYVLWQTRVF